MIALHYTCYTASLPSTWSLFKTKQANWNVAQITLCKIYCLQKYPEVFVRYNGKFQN